MPNLNSPEAKRLRLWLDLEKKILPASSLLGFIGARFIADKLTTPFFTENQLMLVFFTIATTPFVWWVYLIPKNHQKCVDFLGEISDEQIVGLYDTPSSAMAYEVARERAKQGLGGLAYYAYLAPKGESLFQFQAMEKYRENLNAIAKTEMRHRKRFYEIYEHRKTIFSMLAFCWVLLALLFFTEAAKKELLPVFVILAVLFFGVLCFLAIASQRSQSALLAEYGPRTYPHLVALSDPILTTLKKSQVVQSLIEAGLP
ncbi:MAG: hypothetical protein KDC26_04800 [Armatimonadetes bacterium]|nr:hypothetical protein [Armatimonadota bacterium]